MGSKHSKHRTFSEDFIFTLLCESYSSEVSINFICRKYGINSASFYQWQKKYDLDDILFSARASQTSIQILI